MKQTGKHMIQLARAAMHSSDSSGLNPAAVNTLGA